MSQTIYTAECVNFTETSGFHPYYGAVTGVVEVRPPIEAGEGFIDAVLGRDQNGMEIKHVVSTAEVSAFTVKAFLYDVETHKTMIELAADRMAHVASFPDAVVQTMLENPFPFPDNQ